MANPHRGQVTLGEYTLSFSINALCELEDLLDKPMMEIVATIQTPEKMRMSAVRALFWAALRDHHAAIDLNEAGLIVSDLGMKVAMAKVGEAFRLAFPEAKTEVRGVEAKGKPSEGESGELNPLSLLKSWASTGRDAEHFWRLTLKEIHIILEGEAERLKMEHDWAAKFAWHIAYMSAYAPQKPKDFWRLKSLLWKDKAQKQKATPWKDKFAAMANWVSSFKKT